MREHRYICDGCGFISSWEGYQPPPNWAQHWITITPTKTESSVKCSTIYCDQCWKVMNEAVAKRKGKGA
jgi:hypothetical protein